MSRGHVILLAVACAASLILGFITGRRCVTPPAWDDLTPKVDTLYLPDTSAFRKPENEPSPRVITKEIPVPVFVADSAAIDSLLAECARLEMVGDSLQLVLLREQRHYSDSTYDAWVSGVDPRLDSIKTYQRNVVITERIPVVEVRKTRWGLGVQAGVGVSRMGLTEYVGVGVSYLLVSW